MEKLSKTETELKKLLLVKKNGVLDYLSALNDDDDDNDDNDDDDDDDDDDEFQRVCMRFILQS